MQIETQNILRKEKMKIIFEFDTESENFDYQELEKYKQVDKLIRVLSSFLDKVRTWNKWDERSAIPTEEIHKEFYDLVEEEGLDLSSMGY